METRVGKRKAESGGIPPFICLKTLPTPVSRVKLEVASSFCQRRQWQLTPVLLPGKSHGLGSLVSCSPWGQGSLSVVSDSPAPLHTHKTCHGPSRLPGRLRTTREPQPTLCPEVQCSSGHQLRAPGSIRVEETMKGVKPVERPEMDKTVTPTGSWGSMSQRWFAARFFHLGTL